MRKHISLSEKIMWFSVLLFLTLLYVGKQIVSEHVARILIIPISFLMVFFLLKNRFRIRIKISYYHIWLAFFSFYCMLSQFWAINSDYTVEIAVNIVEFFLIMLLLSHYIENNASVDSCLKLFLFTGYLVDIYVILYFGLREVSVMLISGRRISNAVINANTLGRLNAFSIILNLYYILFDKIKWWNIFLFLAVICLIISSSRTALIALAFGIITLLLLKILNGRNKKNKVIKALALPLCILIVLIVASYLPMFTTIKIRLQNLVNGLLGLGKTDSSINIRLNMITLGFRIFYKNPILGIGIDNAKVVWGLVGEGEMYLHNNYVELLADGGMLGFILYYSMFIYLLYLYKRKCDFTNKEYIIGLTLLIMFLVMDFGSISYVNMQSYFLIFVLYYNIRNMKNTYNNQEFIYNF